MTYCCYEKLKSLLIDKGVEFIEPIPSCPKHLNYICMNMAGKCSEGNKRNCFQSCSFLYNNRFFQFHVLYTFNPNEKKGFIRLEDRCIQNLISKNIINESELVVL